MARFIPPTFQFLDDSGLPLSGGTVAFYTTGTLTLKNTYSDSALTTANSNPITLNSAGRPDVDIFLESGTYRIIHKNSAGTAIWDNDPVEGTTGTGGEVVEVTSDTTITASNSSQLLAVDASGGAVTITLLPAATAGDGFDITIVKTDSSSNTVTVDPDGSETIGGAASHVLRGQNEGVKARSDASNWQGEARFLPDVTQALAEAGISTLAKAWTPQRVAQAIAANPPLTVIVGLRLSKSAADTLGITAGRCRDATNAYTLSLGSAYTKDVSSSWAVGTGNGSLDTGSYSTSTLYAVWAIYRSDTGVTDILTSESFSSPTMPANYDYKRLIGFFVTDSGPDILAFTQVGDYFRLTGDVLSDIADSTITGDTFEAAALSVPPNCLAHIYGQATLTSGGTQSVHLYIKTNGAGDAAANSAEAFASMGVTAGTHQITGNGFVLVNGSSQVQYACVGASTETINISTFGCMMLTRSNPV